MAEVLGIEPIHLRVRHHDELLQTCWVSKVHWYVLFLLHWFSAIDVCIECTMGLIAWGAGWEAYIVEAKPSGAFALRPCPECTKSHDVHTHFLILYFAGQNIAHSVRCGNRHFYLTYIAQKLLTHDSMLLLVGEAKRPGGHYEVSTIIIPLPVGI